MTKKELRKIYLEKRNNLSAGECARFNLTLHSNFFTSVDLSFVQVLHIFLPIEKSNEPDTWTIVDRLRREFPHIRISVPRIGTENNLENIYFEGLHQIETSSWGIPEPTQGVPTPPEKIDLVIIPSLVIDRIGHRVGYGRGFYDRFLKHCKPNCLKIGISVFDTVEEITDVDANDVRLDRCITPGGATNFN